MNKETLICPCCGKDITSENTVQAHYDDVMNDPEMGEEERSAAQEEYDSAEDKMSLLWYAKECGCWCNQCKEVYNFSDSIGETGEMLESFERKMISEQKRSEAYP